MCRSYKKKEEEEKNRQRIEKSNSNENIHKESKYISFLLKDVKTKKTVCKTKSKTNKEKNNQKYAHKHLKSVVSSFGVFFVVVVIDAP